MESDDPNTIGFLLGERHVWHGIWSGDVFHGTRRLKNRTREIVRDLIA